MIRALAFIAVLAVLPAQAAQPYAGQQTRTIKALSEADVQGHLEGRGLGYAKAAELNHYPGPLHLRELKEKIQLTTDQLDAITAIEAAMKKQAKALGAQMIDAERALDALFAEQTATADAVSAATAKIGKIKGEIRAAHLNAHVAVRPLLTRHQIQMYDKLRGYGADGGGHGGSHGGHGSHNHH